LRFRVLSGGEAAEVAFERAATATAYYNTDHKY